MFCLFGDTLSFMMFSSFSSVALLLHNQIKRDPLILCNFEQGDLERTRHLLAMW